MKKLKTTAWAVVNDENKIVGGGWGSLQAWYFETKWEAEECLEDEIKKWKHILLNVDYSKWKIIKVKISEVGK